MSGRINTIEAAKIFQTQLDELAVQTITEIQDMLKVQ